MSTLHHAALVYADDRAPALADVQPTAAGWTLDPDGAASHAGTGARLSRRHDPTGFVVVELRIDARRFYRPDDRPAVIAVLDGLYRRAAETGALLGWVCAYEDLLEPPHVQTHVLVPLLLEDRDGLIQPAWTSAYAPTAGRLPRGWSRVAGDVYAFAGDPHPWR